MPNRCFTGARITRPPPHRQQIRDGSFFRAEKQKA
jgi:hypothetical protein